MAIYEQIKPFDKKKMGTKKGWCLQNVAKGFSAYPSADPSASAKSDMQRNIAKGTYHKGVSDIPKNCAVIVYVSSPSQYGHCVAYDKGVYYTDGKRYTPNTKDIIGWGEWCNGFQLVKRVQTKNFLPVKGYWCEGDCDPRIGEMALFMRQNFPAYTSAKALGNYFGKFLKSSIVQFQKRTNLYPDGCVGKKTYAMLQKYGFRY